jgi:hypothetical protein
VDADERKNHHAEDYFAAINGPGFVSNSLGYGTLEFMANVDGRRRT